MRQRELNSTLYHSEIKLLKLTDGKITNEQSIKAGTLWQDQMVLFYLVRRPGCMVCRKTAKEISEYAKQHFPSTLRLVAVFKEPLYSDIEGFMQYFPFEGCIDPSLSVYRQLHNEKITKNGILSLATKWSTWKAIIHSVGTAEGGSFEGDYSIFGGLLLITGSKAATPSIDYGYQLYCEKEEGIDWKPKMEKVATYLKDDWIKMPVMRQCLPLNKNEIVLQ